MVFIQAVKFNLIHYYPVLILTAGNNSSAQIDTAGKLNVHRKCNVRLPLRRKVYWDVHNELEGIKTQAERNVGS